MPDRAVITINRRGTFDLDEVERVLPVVRRITNEFSAKVELMIARLETLQLHQTEMICALENQVNGLIKLWNEKIRKLGAEPRGLWVVDFDHGRGFFSWKHPEPEIAFAHEYGESHLGRKPLSK